ncbi:hypothetical protein GCM10023144_14180 [Pigmentiphaga soli]|uniref:Peptidase S11 D-alanyl-D-alanine carboxypeptidase A N-terminal domain-containing protein n=1 Tax=Pigmentiphaga soli TaxID=1007095 RepID=A0ABP8GQD3_9BURK
MGRITNRIWIAALSCALTLGTALPPATAATAASQQTAKSKAVKAAKKAPARKVTAKAKPKAKARAKVTAKAGVATHIRHASFTPQEEIERVPGKLSLRSNVAFVQDLESSDVLVAKNDDAVLPIASITKLMTALVVVDANLPLDEEIEVTNEDIDTLKHTSSRLVVGTRLSRRDMLHLALMSSENRAASALGRNYPGGLPAFVQAMNAKAALLGMHDTHYVEPTGLSSSNVSSPRDLVRLMQVAVQRPLIHEFTTASSYTVPVRGRLQTFRTTNQLVAKPDWDIALSKTGFINEAGRCLIMLAKIGGRDLAIVLLDGMGSLTRTADAIRIRQWLQHHGGTMASM